MDQLRTELKRKRTGSGRKWPLAVAVIFFGLFFCLGAQPAWAVLSQTANSPLSVDEGSSAAILDTNLEYTGAGTITYTVTAIPAHGALKIGVTTINISDTFTQDEIIFGLLTYEHDGTENFSDSFDFTVTDDDGSLSGTFSININPINENPPVITSNGGGDTASVAIDENTTAVTTVVATDADGTTPTYGLGGGVDDGFFTINGTSGALSFTTAPDYESPADSGSDNTYDVIVTATDGTYTDSQAIAVTISDVNDNAPVVDPGQSFTIDENLADLSNVGTPLTATDADVTATTFQNW
ncbi:MAG: cadherin domain-containing protein, partial [Desulfobacterales bacterium]|nr:cadherin domain-containing protein [Desulfobacterales bacterium]